MGWGWLGEGGGGVWGDGCVSGLRWGEQKPGQRDDFLKSVHYCLSHFKKNIV